MNNKICQNCKTKFFCTGNDKCWCFGYSPPLSTTDVNSNNDCYCEKCLTEAISQKNQGDYYLNDKGFMVFTAAYLKKRGYCCQNGCKHCPY